MFETTAAADIGSAFLRIALRSGVFSDEARAALDPSNPTRVLAFGGAARRLLNASEAHPVGECVSDIELTGMMLRRLVLDSSKRHTLFGMNLVIALPPRVRSVERDAAFAAGRAAGFRRITAVEAGLAGAIGAGLDIGGDTAHMTADIGRCGVRMLTFANGGALAAYRTSFGSTAFDRSIAAWLAENKGVAVGMRAAEKLKMCYGGESAGSAGSKLDSGRSQRLSVTDAELEEAMRPAMNRLITAFSSAMNELPPEAAADLIDNGVTLIGGGAKLHGLPKTLSDALGVPVRMAEDPENAVANGMRKAMRGEAELLNLMAG